MEPLSTDSALPTEAKHASALGENRGFFQNTPLFGSKLSGILSACTLTLPELGIQHLTDGLRSGCLKSRICHIIYGGICFLPLVSGIAWLIWILSPRREQPSGSQPLAASKNIAKSAGAMDSKDVASELSSINSSQESINKYRLSTMRDAEPLPMVKSGTTHSIPIKTFSLPTGTISVMHDKDYLSIGAHVIVSPDDEALGARSGAARDVTDAARDPEIADNNDSPFLQESKAHKDLLCGELQTGSAFFHRVETGSRLAQNGTGFVIHAVGPKEFDAGEEKKDELRKTYDAAFSAALAAHYSTPIDGGSTRPPFSVAICLISTGEFASQTIDKNKLREASFAICLDSAQAALRDSKGCLTNITIHLYNEAVFDEERIALVTLAEKILSGVESTRDPM